MRNNKKEDIDIKKEATNNIKDNNINKIAKNHNKITKIKITIIILSI
jgi:hypothetical protein